MNTFTHTIKSILGQIKVKMSVLAQKIGHHAPSARIAETRRERTALAAALLSVVISYNIFIPLPTLSSVAFAPEVKEAATTDATIVGFPEIQEADWVVTRSYYSQVTVYNSTPEQTSGDPFVTASGERVRDGIVAANCLPFGTRLRMPDMFGDKIFIVKDRLAADKSCFILDIWQEYSPDSKSFGAPTTKIEIIELGEA